MTACVLLYLMCEKLKHIMTLSVSKTDHLMQRMVLMWFFILFYKIFRVIHSVVLIDKWD